MTFSKCTVTSSCARTRQGYKGTTPVPTTAPATLLCIGSSSPDRPCVDVAIRPKPSLAANCVIDSLTSLEKEHLFSDFDAVCSSPD
jgi:hypothetical protein